LNIITFTILNDFTAMQLVEESLFHLSKSLNNSTQHTNYNSKECSKEFLLDSRIHAITTVPARTWRYTATIRK